MVDRATRDESEAAVKGNNEISAAASGRRRISLSIGRRPGDLISLAIAAAVVTLCSLVARNPAINPVEVAIYQQLGKIPAESVWVWRVLAGVGSWIGIAAASALALYFKRIRLGVSLAAAGTLAWGSARILHWFTGFRPVPAELLSDPAIRLPGAAGFDFPSVPAAIAAAMATVAAPYLTVKVRNLAWAVAVLAAAADVYLGGHLPLGAFAGVFLGWGAGTIIHLVLGAPGRRTSAEAVHHALDVAGLNPVRVLPVEQGTRGPLQFTVDTSTGDRLRVEIVRRLHRRAGAWYRLRRLLASLDAEDDPPLSTTYHEAEHEAFVTLFADRAGVRTPPVVSVCETEHGSPLLVRREVEGRRLGSAEIGEPVLDGIWRQVAILSEARIAHHDLRPENFLVDTAGDVWLLDFTFGRVSAAPARCAQDLAEALVSLTALVGVERTVRSARRTLSPDRLETALPYLQPLALPRRIRSQIDGRYVLTDLRETLAETIDRPIPTFRSPVRPRTIVGLLLFGAAVYVLLPQLSGIDEVVGSLRDAHWGWLLASVVTGLLAIVMSSVSFLGSSVTPLPFWRTTAVQLAAAFTGRTTPGGVGFFGINIAFMERLGIRRAHAVGVTLLNLAATGAVSALWCVIGVFALGGSGVVHGVSVPHGWPVLAGAGGALVIAGIVIGSPLVRRRLVRPTVAMARDLLPVLRDPIRALELFGGAGAYLLFSGLGLATSLAAFGVAVPVAAVLVVFVVAQSLGHLAPIPGGLGAVEGLMVAGLTAVGVPPATSVAAVLTSRLLTYWLPVLPGIATFRYLQHHGTI
ncbi:flippase-like domain-containing protein [Amycolatopsis sp. NPDC001319]|uniref:flippase-like domain-containing protein n=1 Tax=unclassified Amycolatopsis TaxID=2618356 RepID=UPI0036CE0CA4